jgi:amino-acid N-acetyltransferase
VTLPAGCELRPARAADAAPIRALVRAARLDPTQLRWPQFWVIACAGQVVACGQLRRFPGAQELGSLVVLPAWQRHGFGGLLVTRLVQTATRPLYLECQSGLVPYYTRFRFVRISWRRVPGPLKWKFGLSRLLSGLVGPPVAAMAYRGPGPAAVSPRRPA